MAGEAFGAKPGDPFGGRRDGVRIVTGAAPKTIARGALAGALCQLPDMAVDLEIATRRVHKGGHEIGQQVARAIVRHSAVRPGNTGLARKMALGTDRIAGRGREFGGIYHFGLTLDMQGARPVAAFAPDAILGKGRVGVTVDRAFAGTDLAGVAIEAGWIDRPTPIGCVIRRITGGDILGSGLRVPGDGRLEEKPAAQIAEAATGDTGADEVTELALVFDLAFGEPDRAFGVDVVTHIGSGVSEGP